MDILEMRATFGKLQDQHLTLHPGLNCIYAPNESGKSTWSQFLRIMLYGLNTRDRGALADKNRYAPWSGAAMRGQLHISTEDGTRLTLSRETKRANAPMGHFTCTYTGTATAVPNIDGADAGEVLLGIPREVFERSAFIRQNALAVDSNKELERRISALITTGEEDASYSEIQGRLKKQLNRRKSNRATGQIPLLEQEVEQLETQLSRIDDLRHQADTARQRSEELTRQVAALEAQQTAWRQWQQQEDVRSYAAAADAAQEAERRAAWLAEAAGQLPDDDTMRRLEGQCAALQDNEAALHAAQEAAQQAGAEAEAAAVVCAAHPLSPADEAGCQAQLDAITAPQTPSPLLPILSAVLLAGWAVLLAFHLHDRPQIYLYGGLTLLWSAILCLILRARRKVSAAQAQACADRTALQEQIDTYLPLLRRRRETAGRAEQAAATAASLSALYARQLSALLAAIRPYAPSAADLSGAQMTLAQLRRQQAALQDARQTARDAAMRRDLLREHLPQEPLPTEEPLPAPSVSQEDLAQLLPDAIAARQEARSQLDTLTGQLRSLDSADDLTAQLQQRRQQLAQLQEEYDAIVLAMETLEQANTTLQNRFSPALGARTAEIFSQITAGRYQTVFLSSDLSLETDSEGAQRSVQLLSQGAADQLYLAVRLAICDMVLPPDKHVPLVLDDALMSFDDDRLHAALDYLLQESRQRQILLFTCQKREGAYLSGRENVTLLTI